MNNWNLKRQANRFDLFNFELQIDVMTTIIIDASMYDKNNIEQKCHRMKAEREQNKTSNTDK